MEPISGRILILLDAPLEVLLGRLGLWLMTWTVGLPARGAFTLQDDSGVGIQGNLGEGGRNKRGEQRVGLRPCTLCMPRLGACTIFAIEPAWLFPQCGSSSTAVDRLGRCTFSMERSSMQMFDFISCVVLYRFVYQPRLTYLFCVVN